MQGVLTEAARRLFDREARLTGASRTDAGVHALRQTASLATTARLPPSAIVAALNTTLPPDIRVLGGSEARPGFNARREAVGKRYVYLLDTGPVPIPLLRRFAWHVPRRLDVEAMRRALAGVRGRHDFGAFCAAPGRDKDPTCVVRAVHVIRRKSRVALVMSADRFLHHMARNIVGSVVAIGRGAHGEAWLADLLRSRDRTLAAATAPAHGLTLVRVLYPGYHSSP